MKNKLIFLLLLFITAVTAYYFYIPPVTPLSPNNESGFIFGSIQSYNDHSYNYRNYDSIGLNCMHTYVYTAYSPTLQKHVPAGWVSIKDSLLADSTVYKSDVRNAMSEAHGHGNSRMIWSRPKIEWLAYGQRSDYQCENLDPPEPTWFYSFRSNNGSHNYTGETVTDSGQTVKRCLVTADEEGYVVDRLKANTEQCRRRYGGSSSINQWMGDMECGWNIKPRIRADQSFISNPANENVNICNIKVIAENGITVLKNVDIKARYFQIDYQHPYQGQYIEEYFFPSGTHLHIDTAWGDSAFWWNDARGNHPESNVKNHADIQVYWYGYCDMYIDYVRVDNDVADQLFKHEHDDWLDWEAQLANEIPGAVYKFYIEYAEFNNLPCIKYINDKLRANPYNTDSVDLVTDFQEIIYVHVRGDELYTIMGADWLKENYIERGGLTAFYAESYPVNSQYEKPHSGSFSKIPYTLPYLDNGNNPPGDSMLAWPISPNSYDEWLQNIVSHEPYWGEPADNMGKLASVYDCGPSPYAGPAAGNFGWVLRMGDAVSKSTGVPFIYMPQAHLWYYPEEIRREPTNEELEMFANLSVTYGARGLMYWWFLGYDDTTSAGCPVQSRGMMDHNDQLRDLNVYGETGKWKTFRSIGDRMRNKWGTHLMSFNNTDRHTYIYKDERVELLTNSYFWDIYSYTIDNVSHDCWEDFPENDIPPYGTVGECKYERYLQAATFKKTIDDGNKYFMIVNRRCSPFINDLNRDNNGGRRRIKVKFSNHNNDFGTINNWKIINLYDNSVAGTFALSNYDMIDLDWFMPGEGRLYKIEPVTTKGGTLVADEVISDDLICEDTVFTNGFNITVENDVDILFTDTSNFVIQGGSFTMGNSLCSGVPNITCGAVSGNEWNGFVFDSCEVRIYNSTFSGFGSDTSYALNMIDCPLIDIRNNAFSNSQNSTLGAINVTYYDIDSINNVYIENNTFELTNSVVPAINILSYAGITTPLIIENNIFSSSTDNSTAILLSGITGGAVKHNTFTNFKTGLNLLSSSIDVSENTLSSTFENSIGILAVSGSEIKMNPSGELQLGGDNNISCTGNGSKNIKVDNSYFNMDYGENVFNIAELNYSYHMNGWFDPFLQVSTNARENCFKLQDQPYAPPIENLKWGEGGSDIEFVFSPYLTGCIPEGCETYYIVDLGGGLYDTICVGGGGDSFLPVETGRGSVASVPNASTQSTNSIILNPKQAYDSLCIYMRLRNYAQAKNKCYELLNNYPDSIQSLNAVNKLFLAVTATDASQNGINQLKIYFETLILNHSGNTALVKRCNYFVQKCKVRMREYSSALTGFQQIISQNPTSYEGLVARWDYMATSLLMHGGGTGGISSIENYELGITNEEEAYKAFEFDESEEFDKFDELGDDRNPFTREEKKAIRNAVNNVLNVSRESNDKRIEILKEKSDVGDVDAKRELEHINKMKEVVKTQKPKNIIEHIKIINSDIQKIFGGKSSNNKSPQNNIPVVYRLAQNYPNPFNPITTIKYELPKDSKVKLVVYDLLGREVKVLVNNEIRSAGYYKLEFNMQNYASGVYFYRIEADDTKGNKFIDAKKMVLVK